MIVGGQLFEGYADHPRVLVALPKLDIQSTAAGRYQLLRRYYDSYRKTLGLKEFSPSFLDSRYMASARLSWKWTSRCPVLSRIFRQSASRMLALS